jgi:hypothetical protein
MAAIKEEDGTGAAPRRQVQQEAMAAGSTNQPLHGHIRIGLAA